MVPQDRAWLPAVWRSLGDVYFLETKYYEAITAYAIFIHLFPTAPGVVDAAMRIATAYDSLREFGAAASARIRLADYIERVQQLHPWVIRTPDEARYVRQARLGAARPLLESVTAAFDRVDALARCLAGQPVADACIAPRNRAQRTALATQHASTLAYAQDLRTRAIAAAEAYVARYPDDDASAALTALVATARQRVP